MKLPKYIEQYQRMKRWYKRFKEINDGGGHRMSSNNYKDEVYAFFINCYHLKDWLKNDTDFILNDTEIEDFVRSNYYLEICGDICNGIKHMNLTRPKIGKGAKMGSSRYALVVGGEEGPLINIKYSINVDGASCIAFDVATEAINAWEKFLSDNNEFFRDNFKLGLLEE
jgi:hypothetical protein